MVQVLLPRNIEQAARSICEPVEPLLRGLAARIQGQNHPRVQIDKGSYVTARNVTAQLRKLGGHIHRCASPLAVQCSKIAQQVDYPAGKLFGASIAQPIGIKYNR